MATYESRRVGANEFSFVGYPMQVMKQHYAHSDLDASFNFFVPIEAGVAVIGVAHHVTEAFSGGTPTIDLGDSGATNSWLTATNLTEGSLNNFVHSIGNTSTNAAGKFFAAADYIKVTGSTELTAGEADIYVFYINPATNWRTENDV